MARGNNATARTGERINGAYELHELLESDADQEIYRATDTRSGTTVQVKLLRPELALQASAVQRFLLVPKTLSGLRHPNLSQVLSIESDATGIPFVVQEHVQGEPLGRTVESFPQGMPLGVAINVLCPVVEAVAAAHERGLVHGRLQSEFVVLAGAGNSSTPKVTRFGQAPAGADARSDVWALGALLYQTLSGQTIERPGAKHESLEDLAPHLPAELLALVERCLSVDAKKRPADASVLRDALTAARDRLRGVERKPPAAVPAVQAAASSPARKAPAAVPASVPAARPASVPAARPASIPAARRSPLPAAPTHSTMAVSNTTPAPAPSRAPAAEARSARPNVMAAGLDATVVAPKKAAAMAARAQASGPVQALPSAEIDPAFALTMAASEDEPELTLEPSRSSQPAARASDPALTMSDLAAAFGPIEGSDRIGQGETEDATRGRSFRKAFEDQQAATVAARKERGRPARRDPPPAQERASDPAPAAVPGNPLSRKQLREGVAAPVRALTDEQMRVLRERTQDEESKRDRIIGMLLFLLFVFALGYFTPLLCDASHQKVQAVFGQHARLAVGGFAIVSVFALIRTWTMQIHQRPMFLRPVNTTLKFVTVLIWILSLTFFLPAGALGQIEHGARMALPWGSSFFYFFLAFYGLVRSAREASANAPAALAMGMLYCGAFFGSYRVLATTVFVLKAKQTNADGGSMSTVAKLKYLVLRTGETPKNETADGDNANTNTNGFDQGDAGTEQEMEQRHSVGANEADDMSSIDQLEKNRKKKSQQFEKLGSQMKQVAPSQ